MLLGLDFNTGDLWMLAAVVSYAIYTALLRRRPAVHGLSFLAATFAIGALMLLPFYAAETLSGKPLPLTMTSALAIGYVAVFASIVRTCASTRRSRGSARTRRAWRSIWCRYSGRCWRSSGWVRRRMPTTELELR